MKYSSAARSFPNGLRIGVTASGQIRVGAIIMNPSGSGHNRPWRTTKVCRQPGLVWTSLAVQPQPPAQGQAPGTVVMKLSALCSI